jgi:hypothetical protein
VKYFMDIMTWIIVGSLCVLVVMNAPKVATVISAGFAGVGDISKTLTGSGYVLAK